MSMNRICLMGRIGRDLELKKTNSGVSVVSFPLAVDRNGKEGGTDWIDVVAWRGTAEVLCNYAGRGRLIGGASLKAPDFAVIVNAASNG